MVEKIKIMKANNFDMKRIYILGNAGSGKTYLAKKLSKILKIQDYNLDDIFFYRKYDKKRSEKNREKLFKSIYKKKKWIIEGGYLSWIEEGIKKSDLVIFIEVPFYKTIYRVFKRFKKRKGKHKETWKDVFILIRSAKRYKKKGYYKHQELIQKHKAEVIYLKNKKEINKFLRNIKK